MSAMPGKHRVVLDVVTPEAMPDGIRFAGNLFNGNKSGYGVDESDMALIMVLRHTATIYGFNDAIWAKHGKGLDPKATPTPTANPYNSGERMQLSALAKRGVQFMVCGAATRAFSGRWARGLSNDYTRALAPLVERGELPDFPIPNALTRPMRQAAGRAGMADGLSLWAGQALPLARRAPAAEIVRRLAAGWKS